MFPRWPAPAWTEGIRGRRSGVLAFAVFASACGVLFAGSSAEPRPSVDVWYGDVQSFGRLGDPQPLLNILGSFSHAEVIADASFRVNGGKPRQLAIGRDLHRLALPGDFNAEIDRRELRPGANEVTIRGRTLSGVDVEKKVVAHYQPGGRWPLPYAVDFGTVGNIQDVAEVIDGKWMLTGDGVRTAEPYYDRVLAFGDASWTDYEVVVDVIYHRILGDFEGRNLKGPPYLDHAHASLALRWGGHPDDGFNPRREWRNIGGLVMLRADLETAQLGSRWWLHFARTNREPEPVQLFGEKRITIELEARYRYRARVETVSSKQSRYAMKVWRAGEAEPDGWDLVGVDRDENVRSGSLLFVVHHADVTFVNLHVIALP